MTSYSSLLSTDAYKNCRLCPRQCGTDRTVRTGYCGCTDRIRVARAALHMWEEPCISGTFSDGMDGGTEPADPGEPDDISACPSHPGGSGAVFFSGCTLGCCFCQNYKISHDRFGKEISVRQLTDCFLRLQDQGAYNINLVTATHYLPSVVSALELVKDRLTIPIVYNCGGYERPEIVEALSGYVDIWLPDLKYMDRGLSARYSQASDYFEQASIAIRQMIGQTGAPVLDDRGIMTSGVVIRHMVLPGARQDSIRLLHWMKENLPKGSYYLSLMSQYTPAGAVKEHAVSPSQPGQKDSAGRQTSLYPELSRRITTYEYESVLNAALELGLDTGYMQKKSSAKEEYTPPFNLEGL